MHWSPALQGNAHSFEGTVEGLGLLLRRHRVVVGLRARLRVLNSCGLDDRQTVLGSPVSVLPMWWGPRAPENVGWNVPESLRLSATLPSSANSAKTAWIITRDALKVVVPEAYSQLRVENTGASAESIPKTLFTEYCLHT